MKHSLLSVTLLGTSLAHASILSRLKTVFQHRARDISIDANIDINFVLESATSLTQLSKKLGIDPICVQAANPVASLDDNWTGFSYTIPQACCGKSCEGEFCSKRGQCQGKWTSSAPPQTGSCITGSTVTTSIPSASATGSAVSISAISTALTSSSTSLLAFTSSSAPQSQAFTPSTSTSTPLVLSTISISGESSTTATQSTSAATVSASESVQSFSSTSQASSIGAILSSSATSITSQTVSSTSTTSTVLLFSSSTIESSSLTSSTSGIAQSHSSSSPSTLLAPLSSTTGSITLSSSTRGSLSESQASETAMISSTINSQGQTVISESGVTVTLPAGLTAATTITTEGQTITYIASTSSTSAALSGASSSSNAVHTSVASNTAAIGNSETRSSVASSQDSQVSASVATSSTSALSAPLSSHLSSNLGTTSTIVSVASIVNSQISSTASSNTDVSNSAKSAATTSSLLGSSTNSIGSVESSRSSGINAASDTTTSLDAATSSTSSVIISRSETSSSNSQSILTTTNSKGQIVISQSGEGFTFPSSLSTALVTTNSDGVVVTFIPTSTSNVSVTGLPAISTRTNSAANSIRTNSAAISTRTNSAGLTVISESGDFFTLPLSLSQPTTITAADSVVATFFPTIQPIPTLPSSSSTTFPTGVLIPVTWDVPTATSTNGGTYIPCKVWFFFVCIAWDVEFDLHVGGWGFNFPPGLRPPGPPPAITFPPELNININIKGELPPWPAISIGPDHLPTYDSQPTECKTKSAELCITKTSFAVSATTTSTKVLSSCATVFGCEVTDSATTTTASCTTTSTATDYYVSCSTTAPGSSTCTTTSSSTTTGCSVTSKTVTCGIIPSPTTSTVPDPACSADTFSYVIYPKKPTDDEQTKQIQSALEDLVKNSGKVQASTVTGIGTIFWTATLTYNQSHEVAGLPNVASVNDDCGQYCTFDATTALNYQDPAIGAWRFWQLSFTSWPRGWSSSNPNPYRYFFDNSLGSGIDVYILDTGATLSHPEFVYLRDRVRWIHVDYGTNLENDNGPGFHGTSMLSLVAGYRTGLAKNVNPILVRTPRLYTPNDWLRGLGLIYNDLAKDTKVAKAPIVMAVYFPRNKFVLNGQYDPTMATGFEIVAHELLTRLVNRGAVLVTGAGNVANDAFWDTYCDGWPANFGKSNNPLAIPSLMVLGAINEIASEVTGKTDPPNNIPHFYAPGLNVESANGNTRVWGNPLNLRELYKYAVGTSCAAALTAALSAYFMNLIQSNTLMHNDGTSIENSPQGIKDFIMNQNEVIWSRRIARGLEKPAIWNKADLGLPYCSWSPDRSQRLLRRQETSAASCYTPDTTQLTTAPTSIASVLTTELTSSYHLTTAPVAVRSGSSCVSTSVVTDCVAGPPCGGPSATCVSWVATSALSRSSSATHSTTATISSLSSSASSSSTSSGTTTKHSTTASSTVSLAPMQTSPVVCHNVVSEPGHADISPDDQKALSNLFCNEFRDSTLNATGPWVTMGLASTDNIGYRYQVIWRPDCKQKYGSSNLYTPLGTEGANCPSIFIDTFANCDDGGIGGYIDLGCLRYNFIGGLDPSTPTPSGDGWFDGTHIT